MDNDEKVLIPVSQIEKKTDLGHTQVYKEINSGRLRTLKVGKRRFTTPEWLSDWVAYHANKAA